MKKTIIALGLLFITFMNSCVVEGRAGHHRHGVGGGVYVR